MDNINGSGRVLLTASEATIFTTHASNATTLVEIDFANTSTLPVTVRVSVGTDSATTRIIPDVTVPAKGKYQWKGQEKVGTAVNIRGSASTTSVINCNVTVVESS